MPKYEAFDWYENPLYYDIIFDVDTETEASFVDAVYERHVQTRGRRMLEPACGSGRLVAAMARRGFNVTGFDLSEEMLRFARRRLREKHLKARLVEARLESFSFASKFDIAHCLVSTFKYLMDEKAARSHLQRIANALKPGGVYVLGLHLTDYDDRARSRERWLGSRGRTRVICNIQSWPADRRKRTEHVRARLIIRCNDAERRYETHWTFRSYSLRQLKSLLRSVPRLELVATYDFSHHIDCSIVFDGTQLDIVLILRRR